MRSAASSSKSLVAFFEAFLALEALDLLDALVAFLEAFLALEALDLLEALVALDLLEALVALDLLEALVALDLLLALDAIMRASCKETLSPASLLASFANSCSASTLFMVSIANPIRAIPCKNFIVD